MRIQRRLFLKLLAIVGVAPAPTAAPPAVERAAPAVETWARYLPHEDHVAFYVSDEVQPYSLVRASRVLLPDGTHPAAGSAIQCGTCGAVMSLNSNVLRRR